MINKRMIQFPITYTDRIGGILLGWGAHETVADECHKASIRNALIVTTGLKGTGIVDGIEQKYKRHMDVVYVSVDEPDGKELARESGVIGTPTFLLLDSEGTQVNVLRGSLPAPVIEKAIEALIAQ